MAHFATSCVFLSRTAIGPPPNVTLATTASRCLVRLECTATFHVYTHISDRREVFAFQTNTREGAGCDPTWATTRRSWPRRSALVLLWDGVDSFPKRIDLTIILSTESNLVDSASSHTLVSKIKPCMSKYKRLYTVKLRTAH